MDHLVPIGRFSDMTRLTVKALRHYDEVGLLTPAHVDESSGYRYYRLGQANRAEAIRILRGVDMPLDETSVPRSRPAWTSTVTSYGSTCQPSWSRAPCTAGRTTSSHPPTTP